MATVNTQAATIAGSGGSAGGGGTGTLTLKLGTVGASLEARNIVWRALSGSTQIRRVGDTIICGGQAHGLPEGERVCIRSRRRELSTAIVVPTIISGTEIRLPALFTGLGDYDHPGGVDSQFWTDIHYVDRWDCHGSWMRHMAMHPMFGGRVELIEDVAQGGDNEPEILAKFESEILPACRRLAAAGGFMVGNLGGDLQSWQPPAPINIQRIRAITGSGATYVSVEGSANSPLAANDTADRIASVEYARFAVETEAESNPRLIIVDNKSVLADQSHPAGAARPGLHIDDVHLNQGGNKLRGDEVASTMAPRIHVYARKLRMHQGDQWTTGPVNIGGNVARGLFAGSASGSAAFAAGQPGTGTISGTVDAAVGPLERTGDSAITVTASITNLASGRRSQRFVISKTSAGTVAQPSLIIPIQGPSGTEWWRQMAAGRYELGIEYVLADSPTRLQALEIYADTGSGTARRGAFSSFESPAYLNLPDITRAEMVSGEGGVAFFPGTALFSTAPANFRLVVRPIFVAGVPGSCTIDITDFVTRRIA